jgi:prepilin signal peptidase PulO-like enzyme (type II secretory pathway)
MSIFLLSALAATYLVLVALLVGSFINLAADRVPRGESVLWPRSHCRSCARVLNVVDLVPVAGYVVRGGRCATCATAIGAASPFVEAASGALMLAAILWLGLWPGAAVGVGLIAALGFLVVGLSLARHRRAAEAR